MKKNLELEDDHHCFACGMENLDGLRVEWQVDGQTMIGKFVPSRKFQGWKGIVHGGILATLLDEAMTRLAGILYGGAVTAEMTVRYVAPAPIGEMLFIRGEIVDGSRKIIEMKASIHAGDESGKVIARASGRAVKAR